MPKLLIEEAEPSAMHRWRRRAVRLLVVLVAVGIVAELALRLTAGPPDGPEAVISMDEPGAYALQDLVRAQTSLNLMIYQQDPELGALLAPDRADTVQTVDFTYTLATDHAGFPNREPWPDRADVAVLGNSLLVGPGVGIEGQFTSLLEGRLQDRSVMNFGLPGGGTEHMLLSYRRFVEPLQPGLVVATLWVVWDVENSRQFAYWQREGKPDPDFTHYRYTFGDTHRRPSPPAGPEGGEPEPTGLARVVGLVRSALGSSRLIRTTYDWVQSIRAEPPVTVLARFPEGGEVALSADYQSRLARGIDRSDTPDMRDIFFDPLEELRDEVRDSGGRFLVMLVPSKEEVYGSEATPSILRLIDEVREGLQARGLPVLDLYPVFREYGWRSPPFYRADMHLNELGNEIVADAMAEWIATNGAASGAAGASSSP